MRGSKVHGGNSCKPTGAAEAVVQQRQNPLKVTSAEHIQDLWGGPRFEEWLMSPATSNVHAEIRLGKIVSALCLAQFRENCQTPALQLRGPPLEVKQSNLRGAKEHLPVTSPSNALQQCFPPCPSRFHA